MSNISIKVLNEANVRRAFRLAPKKMTKGIQHALQVAGAVALGKTKEVITAGTGMWKAPVDTGTMRRLVSIVEKRPLRVTIAPNMGITPYATYVHEGTRYMRQRPFFTITKDRHASEISRVARDEIRKVAKNIIRI